MGKVEKISVALTPELASTVREAVASGDYASTSEVMRDALRGWREVRADKTAVLEVRTLLAEAEVSGYKEGLPNFDAIKRQGRQRLAEQRK